jgi:hypothetical protein
MLLNPAGTVHGGFSATLLDSCMGLAIQSTLEKGFGQTTLEFICGWPPRARDFEAALAEWSGAVICPALRCGAYGRRP